LTPHARAVIERADVLLYLVTDPVTATWLEGLNSNAQSLDRFYEAGKDRRETYAEMTDAILAEVRRGGAVCTAFYGHPGVFVDPGHEAIRRARLEGFRARMLPGISAEDCLVADLGLDPAGTGCQTFEATAFLLGRRPVDTTALLVLWQVGFLGQLATTALRPDPPLEVLCEYLAESYPLDHEVIVYEASLYAVAKPFVRHVSLGALPDSEVPPMATLIVPPTARASLDATMFDRLGLPSP
jgi:uncharacterized protein YabN with tetrapyrrole methylase and pyrophosphatase domain